MPVTRAIHAPIFTVPGFRFIGLTAPSRGATEICTWQLQADVEAKSVAHRLDHEETFIVLDGTLTTTVDGEDSELAAGDAIVVPAHSLLQVANQGNIPSHAIVCLPAGTRATHANGGEIGTPQWAQ
jgi:mannose-6-phosphate isomerase-like protein (cupin superfamily)